MTEEGTGCWSAEREEEAGGFPRLSPFAPLSVRDQRKTINLGPTLLPVPVDLALFRITGFRCHDLLHLPRYAGLS